MTGDPAPFEHMLAAIGVPAVFSTHAFVQPMGLDLMRVSFGEGLEGSQPKYRSAIVISNHVALELAALLIAYAEASIGPQASAQPANDAGADDAAPSNGEAA